MTSFDYPNPVRLQHRFTFTDPLYLVTVANTYANTVPNRGFTTIGSVLIPRPLDQMSLVGVNSVPPYCKDHYCTSKGEGRLPMFVGLGHAENNTIAYAARHGIPTEGATIALNWWPCIGCAHQIVNAGISHVFGYCPDFDYKPTHYDFRGSYDYLVSEGVNVQLVDRVE